MKPISYDLDKARDYLAKAGYTISIPPPPPSPSPNKSKIQIENS